jgi:uncharacterized protein YndB with AHSA1/START domain
MNGNIHLERRLDHPVERVWRAVTEPKEMERWFVATVDWKPELGETFEAHGQRGEITRHDPPHVLEWTWGPELYRFEVRAEGGGSILTFTHQFPEGELQEQHTEGWLAYFARLDVHLEGGFLSEEDAHRQAAGTGAPAGPSS